VETDAIVDRDGRVIPYKRVRFIPETRAQLGHLVRRDERLDHIAHRYYRDPERFWRICDANRTMRSDDLTAEPGRTILIPPSQE
jgi:nucleoid-associated protein YgaU